MKQKTFRKMGKKRIFSLFFLLVAVGEHPNSNHQSRTHQRQR
jgi:hypothetical protein